jgi:predicted nucleic acid-binding protein
VADVLIDACCLINLLSGGRPDEILIGGGHNFHVCEAVAEEALFIEVLTPDQTRRRSKADLGALFQTGSIRRCKPETTEELAAFVRYAKSLDDGEAMCLALAKCRSWVIATDERKGRRIATADGIAVMNTVEVVKAWVVGNDISESVVRELVTRVGTFGRYRPALNTPSAEWWRDMGGPLAT